MVVLNGEIYNYRELRERLEQRRPHVRHPLRHRGDRAPLRGAWARDCVEHLHGMFGLAIWDARRRAAGAGARPAGQEAALLLPARRDAVVRLRAARAGARPGACRASWTTRPWTPTWRSAGCPDPAPPTVTCASSPPASTLVFEEGRATTRALLAAGVHAQARRAESPHELRRADPRAHPGGHPAAAGLRRAARRLPVRRRRLRRGGRRDGRGVAGAGSGPSRSASRPRSTTSCRWRALVAEALRHRAPRDDGRARRDGDHPQDRAPLRRAVRRRLGDPQLLRGADGAPARDGRAERRRRRRELRRLPALRRPGGAGAGRPTAGGRPGEGLRRLSERLPASGRINSWPSRGAPLRARADPRRSRPLPGVHDRAQRPRPRPALHA